ncbi:hypothetical protein F5X96DRAFT_49592 [Biscogniauxia mediterranea]|nr:hypothetical protein F5X96DRAFT_49592 [Biscogniauxia mediterranea]
MRPGLRRWTQMDDAVLEAVIQRVGKSEDIKWDEIASYLPGRSPSECLHHWEQKMSSSLNTGTWLPEEDDQLRAAVAKHGTKWTAVAAEVGTRNGEQCAKRWNDKLRPDLDHGAWTTEEDNLLLSMVEMHGRTWKTLSKSYFTNRAPLALKNRYTLLERRLKKKRSESSASCSVATASSSPNSQRDIDCADGQSSWSDAQTSDLYSTDLAGMNFTEANQTGDQEALHAAYWQGMVSQPSFSPTDVSGITPDILDANVQFTNPWHEPSPEHMTGSHSSGYSAWDLPNDLDLPLTQLSVSIPRRKAGEIVGQLMDIAITGDEAAAPGNSKVKVTLQLK